MPEQARCTQCRASRGDADPITALSWVSEHSGGPEQPVRWLCPRCARTHVRDIEGKLSAEWW